MCKDIEENFKSIHIDLENGVYELNGRDISEICYDLELRFHNGKWSLTVKE